MPSARDRNRIELTPSAWIDPAEWEAATTVTHLRYLNHVGETAVRLKRSELRRGIGADGAPLAPVRRESRPDGATGKPLDPHYGASRSVANLRAAVGLAKGTVTLWWTGRVRGLAFGAILGYHARGEVRGAPVRDVLDLTEGDLEKLQADARRFWKLITRASVSTVPRLRIPPAARPQAVKYPHLGQFLATPGPAKPVRRKPLRQAQSATLPATGPVAELTPSGQKRLAKAVEYAQSKGVTIVANAANDIEASKGENSWKIPGMYHAGTKTIYLNQRSPYWDDPAATMAEARKINWLSSDRPAHVIIHEVGHAEHHKAVGTVVYNQVRAQVFTPEEKAVAGRVSRYAATKPIEIVPEVYAGLVAGKQYDSEVMALYASLRGPTP
jgi:hypothetical protein